MSDFISSDHHLNQQRWSDLNVEVSPFRSAFEHAAIGMVLSDMDGRCLAANRAFCDMVGYAEDELLQMEFAQITHPDDLPENLRLGHQLLSGEISTFRLEKRYFHKQGHTLWGLLSASLVRDSHGLPLYVISQIQDITEWRQAQAALARSEANQRAMLNAMPDVVLQLSRDARVLACHGPVEQVLALPRETLPGRSLGELLTAPQWLLAAEAIERACQTGQLQLVEFTQPLDGRPHFYEGRFTPTSTQDILLLIRDVTQRQLARLAELEQRELAEALRDTAAALSSTLNMDELLDRVLFNLQRVVTHEAADVMLVDADQVAHITRRRGYSDVDGGDMSRAVRFPVITTANLRRMTDSRAPLIIADVRRQPGWVRLPALHWVRSYVGAPLCTKQAVIGFIGLMSSQPDFFNADDAERLQAFAQQAAIAIDNVRLFQAERAQSDLAEALRDTAAALNSTPNLDEVLDRILANASRVVPYDAINIMLLDERRTTARVVRQLGYAERNADAQVAELVIALDTTFGLRYMAESGNVYVVPDTHHAADWVKYPGTYWIRSYVGVPIQIDGRVGGFLNLDSATPGFFTREHATRLQAFADQIATAIRNAQLFDTAQQNLRRLSEVYNASLDLARAGTLPLFYQQLLRSTIRLANSQAAALLLYDGEQHLVVTAVDGLPERLLGERIPLGSGVNGRAAEMRRILQVHDYRTFEDQLALMRDLPLGGVIVLPLIWQDRLVGTLSVYDHEPRVYNERDVRTLSLFATLAAIAVEQRRAAADAEARETEARLLSARLSNAQEQERARIAGLLHDTLGTHLVTLQRNTEMIRSSLGSEAAPQYLAANLDLLQRAHALVRDLAADLDSRVLVDLGLVPAVRQYIDRLRATTGLKIDLHVTGSIRRLSHDMERIAFRGLQEALTNALRHAQASEIVAQLHLDADSLRLTVQDNGRGFDPLSQSHGTELGLPQLRRQVEALKGELMLESAPGAGTMVVVQLPVQMQRAADPSRARVLIVDDHEMMRHGLRDMLAATDDLACIGEASTSEEAIRLVEQLRPDVITMDVKLPDSNGIDTARRALRLLPRTRVVMLTYHDDETYLDQAMQAGAAGYLLKSDHSRVILAGLRAVLGGETFISPTLAEKWAILKARPATTSPVDLLTARERQVLQLLASGLANQQIHDALGISVRTVEVHRRNIMDKLGYRNTPQLIQFALQHGLV